MCEAGCFLPQIVLVVVLRARAFPGPSETPAHVASLFLLSYVHPFNRPQSVTDHDEED
jgi:hypothetical protein